MNNDYGHWDIKSVGYFEINEWYGFIYEITNKVSNKSYIGKKNFWFTNTKPPLKGKKRRRKIVSESDWKLYCSSSDILKKDIELIGKSNFTFKILQLCSGKSELSYLEEKYQYENDVLMKKLSDGSPAYYNRTISHKHFAGVENQTEESRKKISISLVKYYENIEKGPLSDDIKKKISNTLKEKYNNGDISSCFSESENWDVTFKERMEYGRKLGGKNSLSDERRIEIGKKTGKYLVDNNIGIFGYSDIEKKEICSKGGKTTGKMKWWTDGKTTKRSDVCPGDSWVPGRLPRSEETKEKISQGMKNYKSKEKNDNNT